MPLLCRMLCITLAPVLAAALGPAEARGDNADALADATRLVEETFARELAIVGRSATRDDDIALGRQLNEASDLPDIEPQVAYAMCDKAVMLTGGKVEGFGVAMTALHKMLGYLPQRRASVLERIIEVERTHYLTLPLREREEPMIRNVRRMMQLAVTYAEQRDYTKATAAARQAWDRTPKSARDLADAAKQLLSRITDEAATYRRFEIMARAYEQAPSPARAGKLAEIALVQLNDVKTATEYADKSEDVALQQHFATLAAQPDDVTTDSLYDTSMWLLNLAGNAPQHAKVDLYSRIGPLMAQFMERDDADALRKAKAKLTIEDVTKIVSSLGGGTDALLRVGGSFDLLAAIDLEKHVLKGTAVQTEGRVVLQVPRKEHARSRAMLVAPIAVSGSYDMTARVRRDGNGSVGFLLPVGPSTIALTVDEDQHGVHVLMYDVHDRGEMKRDRVKRFDAGFPLTEGMRAGTEPIAFDVSVRTKGTDAGILLKVNGKQVGKWTGPVRQLRLSKHWRGLQANLIALAARYAYAEWESVQFKLVSGKARPVDLVVTPLGDGEDDG